MIRSQGKLEHLALDDGPCVKYKLYNITLSQPHIAEYKIVWVKESRIQSIPLNQNKFQNNSGGKIQRHLQNTLIDIYDQF